MVVFDRLGPVVKIPVVKNEETKAYEYNAEKAEKLKKSTKHQHAELFSPADLKVIATQTEILTDENPDNVWSDPSVGSEAEMLTPPNLTGPEDGTTTHIEVPEEDTP